MRPDVATMSDAELRAEMHGYLRGKAQQRWHFIKHGGRYINRPVFRADGTASAKDTTGAAPEARWDMPQPATERQVLEALVHANRELHERRSRAAKKAGETRARRRERLVYDVAQRLKDGGALTPSARCIFCRRSLTDAESRERGIGAECWGDLLRALEGQP